MKQAMTKLQEQRERTSKSKSRSLMMREECKDNRAKSSLGSYREKV